MRAKRSDWKWSVGSLEMICFLFSFPLEAFQPPSACGKMAGAGGASPDTLGVFLSEFCTFRILRAGQCTKCCLEPRVGEICWSRQLPGHSQPDSCSSHSSWALWYWHLSPVFSGSVTCSCALCCHTGLPSIPQIQPTLSKHRAFALAVPLLALPRSSPLLCKTDSFLSFRF